MNSRRLAAPVLAAAGLSFVLGGLAAPGLFAQGQPVPVTKESSAVFRRVAKSTLPAVVSIQSEQRATPVAGVQPGGRGRPQFRGTLNGRPMTPEQMEQFFGGGGMPDGLRRFFEGMEDLEPEPRPNPGGAFGSGVIVRADADGAVVLTNNHVVAGADQVTVLLPDNRQFSSTEIFTDPKTDLAIVKLTGSGTADLPTADLGDSDQLEIGDWVLAMGSPFGLQGTVTAGIISAKGRPLPGTNLLYQDFLQTDASINPGNSGGPLVDLDGRVVGINTAIRSRTGTFSGVGFAVPASMIKGVVDQLVETGRVRRGYLGVRMGEPAPGVLNRLGLDGGVQVVQLTPGDTPARRAGLQAGDVITAIAGDKVAESAQVQGVVTRTTGGTELVFSVYRDGQNLEVPVTIADQPDEFGLADADMMRRTPQASEGVLLDELGVEVVGTPQGVQVRQVQPGSPADQAGIVPGTIVEQIERQDLSSPDELQNALTDQALEEGVLMKVRLPDGSTRLIVVEK